MTQSSTTDTYSLESVLARIEGKIDDLQKDVTEIKAGQVKLETEMVAVKEDIKDLKGTQKNQIWTLITLLGGSLIAVEFRAFFANNP